jgi:hypothetical protein
MALELALGLKEDERILAAVRSAPVTLLFPAAAALLFLFAPFFFMVPLVRWETLGGIIMGLSWGLGTFIAIRTYVKWRWSVFVVTDRRLIIVRRDGFFSRHVTELPFAKVHEIAYRVRGFFPTVFRYGTVLIDKPLEVRCVSRPGALQNLLTELQSGTAHGAGDFGEMLEGVSKLGKRDLLLLRSEIDRSLGRMLEVDEDLLS